MVTSKLTKIIAILSLVTVTSLAPRPAFAFCFTPTITDQGGCLAQCQCEADWCYADASTWSDRYSCHQAQAQCSNDCKDFFPT